MTVNEARTIIQQAFIDEWDPPAPEVPYSFENEKMDVEDLDEWARLRVIADSGGQHTLGSIGERIFRRKGAVVVHLATAVNQGLLRLDELGAAALTIFEGRTLSRVMFHSGIYRVLPSNGRWAEGEVSVLLSFDETK